MIIFELTLKFFAAFTVEFTTTANCVMIALSTIAVIVTFMAVVAVSNAIDVTAILIVVVVVDVVDAFSYGCLLLLLLLSLSLSLSEILCELIILPVRKLVAPLSIFL